jgi:type II secretion system protein G
MPFGCASAGWGLAARAAAGSILRLAIYLLALSGLAVGICQVMLELTAHCVIRKNQSQFVWAQLSLERFGKALERYREDCKSYPAQQIGLRALVVNPGARGWNGPYTKQLSIDPWGRPYIYEIANGVPLVRSLGADGKPGGDLFDADLSSQDPMAPIHENRFHAVRRFFEEKAAPWLLTATSLWFLVSRSRGN